MAYMIEGGGSKNFSKAKTWLFKYPDAAADAINLITTVSIEYLVGQVKAGAQLLQVFESWAGELSESMFRKFLLPVLKTIATTVKQRLRDAGIEPVPMVIFAKGAHYALEDLATTEFDVIQIDWTMDPVEARKRVGPNKTLQGNLDPCTLYGDDDVISSETEAMVTSFGTHRYIANLGHGMHPTHKPEKLKVFVDALHAHSERQAAAL